MIKEKLKAFKAFLAGLGFASLSFLFSAITISNGVIQWEAGDKTAIEGGISNAFSNIWAGLVVLLPYLGLAAGFFIVFGLIMKLAKGRR